ncbi:hypothetical protein VKT23_014565 [Stygiomarasmius scandens]|uniref:RBR-type E3 ubiquitin transferase n=1 Tax=Marasmiellus scandens TaxID=2682957 RepID=A0ABR1J2S6_9AGAR
MKPQQICPTCANRDCRRGSQCSNAKSSVQRPQTDDSNAHESRSPESKTVPKSKRDVNQVCYDWTVGRCSRGDKCRYRHVGEPMVSGSGGPFEGKEDVEPSDRKAAPDLKKWRNTDSAEDKELSVTEGTALPSFSHPQKARPLLGERNEEEAETVQHLVLGTTIVKFSAGLAIEHIITGFEARRIRITNLPTDTTAHDLTSLLLGQGIDKEMFQFVNLKRWKGKKEGNFIVHESWGDKLSSLMDGFNYRGEFLTVEASDSGTLEGMNANGGILYVTWEIPSSLKQSAATGSGSGDVHRSPTSYNQNTVEESLKQHILTVMPRGVVKFDRSPTNAASSTDCTSFRVHFRTWGDAKEVYDQLVDRKFDFIGNSVLRLRLSSPYQITLSMQQYMSQKQQWDLLIDDTNNRQDRTLRMNQSNGKMIVHVSGNDLKAVGMLKVRVESLVAGVPLSDIPAVWFGSAAGQKFLKSIYTTTGAYIKHDGRLKVLKAYGEQSAILNAQDMLRKEVKRTSDLQHTETLAQESIRFFVQRGVPVLNEAFGEDSVYMDLSTFPVRITVRAGEDGHHLLKKLIGESLRDAKANLPSVSEFLCPVCYMEASNPVKLACGHEYCTACIRHLLTSSVNNFPIVCTGGNETCVKPVTIPFIQKFLSPSQFTKLMETAFITYIGKNPQIYRYCKTPDCRQIYQCSDSSASKTPLQCPSCLVSVCMKCHGEHEGMNCAERHTQIEEEQLDDAWARGAGAQKCPACYVWIQKVEGCDHMTCKCGAQFCWICLKTFAEPAVIHGHERTTHSDSSLNNHPKSLDETITTEANWETYTTREGSSEHDAEAEYDSGTEREAEVKRCIEAEREEERKMWWAELEQKEADWRKEIELNLKESEQKREVEQQQWEAKLKQKELQWHSEMEAKLKAAEKKQEVGRKLWEAELKQKEAQWKKEIELKEAEQRAEKKLWEAELKQKEAEWKKKTDLKLKEAEQRKEAERKLWEAKLKGKEKQHNKEMVSKLKEAEWKKEADMKLMESFWTSQIEASHRDADLKREEEKKIREEEWKFEVKRKLEEVNKKLEEANRKLREAESSKTFQNQWKKTVYKKNAEREIKEADSRREAEIRLRMAELEEDFEWRLMEAVRQKKAELELQWIQKIEKAQSNPPAGLSLYAGFCHGQEHREIMVRRRIQEAPEISDDHCKYTDAKFKAKESWCTVM